MYASRRELQFVVGADGKVTIGDEHMFQMLLYRAFTSG
jgi:hypothetical protein